MRVATRKGFEYHSVKLVYWLTITGVRLIQTRFFFYPVKPSIHLNIALSQLRPFLPRTCICSLWCQPLAAKKRKKKKQEKKPSD
jgi:hypothetical protein